MNKRIGDLFVIAAPSGGGKTSLVRALVQQLKYINISISHTTRLPRPGDQEGVDYFFVDDAKFQQMIAENAFLEHAIIYGFRYGTTREWVLQQLGMGVDVVLEIDWQGARQICRLFPQAQSIFILPPSMQTLETRLQKRGQDGFQVIEERLQAARSEITHFHEFDYLIVNQVFEQALQDLIHIICARRLRMDTQSQILHDQLDELLHNQA